MTTLTVNEVFGPTIQGEGPSAGHRAGFLRLGRCNESCSWCDEPQSWDWSKFDPAVELRERTTADLLAELDAMDVDLVVITGGEPLLQQRQLATLIDACRDRGWRVEVETNGTIVPTLPVTQWNVSPKLENAGMTLERRYRPDVLRAFEATGRAAFKFVVTDPVELNEVQAIVDDCGLSNVWIMPEGTDASIITARMAELADDVIKRGWHLTPRLHILIWGDRRGV
jgi:7-cyano-7-deazaguanosine (preQ0) biosynthesis protein QueE